ncbi:hypothetical protein [Burkholderia sp. Ac-20344]|uniref:hypothetical protein n=1 Tax=Burkholderia sp. Ac-20344 TaxID=2703890 RepID=UPI00197C780F|nr:hypothetical protein [Burkholderia sp. Ac-20344]MBN3833070.1 hypothetical protein [Burkholderia sp. Ac-20344]
MSIRERQACISIKRANISAISSKKARILALSYEPAAARNRTWLPPTASPRQPDELIDSFHNIVDQWGTLATGFGLSAREQERMSPAFHLASD